MQAAEIHRPLCPVVNPSDSFGSEEALQEICHLSCTFGSRAQPRSTALPKTGSGTKLIQHMTSPTVGHYIGSL